VKKSIINRTALRIWLLISLVAGLSLTSTNIVRAQTLTGSALDLKSMTAPVPPIATFENAASGESWDMLSLNGFMIQNISATPAQTTPLFLQTNAPDYSFYASSNGSIGFGTHLPAAKLHAVSADLFATLRLETSNPSAQAWDLSSSSAAFELVDHTNGDALPFTVQALAPTDSLFVSSNGSIGMGTSQPTFIGSVNGGGRCMNVRATNGPARFVLQGSVAGELNLVHNNAPANQRNFRIRSEGGFTGFHVVNDTLTGYPVYQAIQIDMKTGNIGLQVAAPTNPLELKSGARCTTGGVWTNASSRDLKQDIEPLTSEQARDAVLKLQPVGYRYKSEPDEKYVGFIAEDVPELVATNDRKSLASMDIMAVLTKVVQDQQTVINNQREELASLKDAMKTQSKLMDERLERLEKLLALTGKNADQ